MSTAPHLCRPIEFLFPAYRGERPGLRIDRRRHRASTTRSRSGVRPRSSRRLDPSATLAPSPRCAAAGLQGAQLYTDCQTDDARLVLENVLDAERAGAAVLSHVARAVAAARPPPAARAAPLVARPRLGGDALEIRARIIVNATGPFSDALRLAGGATCGPTLGVHLVFDAARLTCGGRAVVLRAPRDGRIFFALPARAAQRDRHHRHRLDPRRARRAMAAETIRRRARPTLDARSARAAATSTISSRRRPRLPARRASAPTT